ncbi:hypothetical protein [Solimonas soli]|uniref:hypothetical protein n=1 Tax=Solimonas soli TaxID=413479 RepID=UPI00048013AC|nr:hypothetical protein [Solimonas soli]
MSKRPLNLFESAVSRARVIRQGDITQIVIDGGGAFVTFTQEFYQAQKWAMPKTATGNMITDRGRFFEQIGTLISRPGSMVSTRGHSKHVEQLARKMNQAGYEIGEWMLPPELKDIATAHLRSAARPKKNDAAADGAPPPPDAPAAKADEDDDAPAWLR